MLNMLLEFLPLSGGTRILLFYECLPNKSATFYPNSSKNRGCNPYKKRVKVASHLLYRTLTRWAADKDLFINPDSITVHFD